MFDTLAPVKTPRGADVERTITTHVSLAHSKMEERDREREHFLCTVELHARARAAAKVRDEGDRREGGNRARQSSTVALVSLSDAEMSEVSCASDQRKN